MRHPHLGFVIGLLVVGPVFAIAGMSASGVWPPLGVGAGAMVVAAASARSTMFSYRDRTTWSPIRWRMFTLTAIVTAAAVVLAMFSVVWVVRVLAA
jgi:hypothetical protein